VVAVGIKGEADPALEGCVDEMHWTGLARLGEWIRTFKQAGVTALLMAGGIEKRRMFQDAASLLPDWRSVRLWYSRLASKEDHTILGAVADEFEADGIRVASVVDYCPELLMQPGCLSRRLPSAGQWRDIRFAWPLAKQVAALQVGQCIVVKNQAVIAVEGIDGTDAVLERGGGLAGGGAVAVKVPREGHDRRFDVPCIGPGTADVLARSGIAVLAVQACGTIVLDRDAVKRRADEGGVCIVAVTPEELGREPAR
jgi:hypothetical protein